MEKKRKIIRERRSKRFSKTAPGVSSRRVVVAPAKLSSFSGFRRVSGPRGDLVLRSQNLAVFALLGPNYHTMLTPSLSLLFYFLVMGQSLRAIFYPWAKREREKERERESPPEWRDDA